jgi:hypothetical protein
MIQILPVSIILAIDLDSEEKPAIGGRQTREA